jgi:hypothetical protein
MRGIWDALEMVDRAVFAVLETKDRLLGHKDTLLTRAQKKTEHIKPPQPLITFDT